MDEAMYFSFLFAGWGLMALSTAVYRQRVQKKPSGKFAAVGAASMVLSLIIFMVRAA